MSDEVLISLIFDHLEIFVNSYLCESLVVLFLRSPHKDVCNIKV